MMTLTEPDKDTGTEPGPMSDLRNKVLMVLCALVALFALGVSAGAAVAGLEDGFDWKVILPVALGLGIAAAGVAGYRAFDRMNNPGPVAPSVRRAQRLLLLSIVVGVLMGMFLSVGADEGAGADLISNDPLPSWLAVCAIGVWIIAVPPLTWLWMRSVDELERSAYLFASLVAFHFYLLAVPVWWMGWRGGFLPEPQEMISYIAAMLVFTLAWTWRRYF